MNREMAKDVTCGLVGLLASALIVWAVVHLLERPTHWQSGGTCFTQYAHAKPEQDSQCP